MGTCVLIRFTTGIREFGNFRIDNSYCPYFSLFFNESSSLLLLLLLLGSTFNFHRNKFL